jgi:predicted PhzF superfamily epimerase YddE/YHI9
MSIQVDVVRVFTAADGGHGNELGIIQSPVPDPQEIATRLNFSETVFVRDVTDARATIGIFTPASELPFAGHPSVGTAWFLSDVEVLVEKAGDVTVRREDAVTWITGDASWAPAFEWHELASVTEVDALDPASVTDGKHYYWAWVDEAAGTLRSRMFAPGFGIIEDEATGAAAVSITATLGRDLLIHQGAGSVIHTRLLDGGRVEVGGRTVFDRTIILED